MCPQIKGYTASTFGSVLPKRLEPFFFENQVRNPLRVTSSICQLRCLGHGSETQMYTALSRNTASDEVLELARHWIRTCTSESHESCPNESFSNRMRYWDESDPRRPLARNLTLFQSSSNASYEPRFYPTRLIEFSANPQERPELRLIETSDVVPEGHYVTLSHCWGGSNILKLTRQNLDDLKEEISLDDLSVPKTFKDAFNFVRRLSSRIRYIWIDSLCIIQNDSGDWAREAVRMYQIYRNSYCNISATASSNSFGGLYYSRDPHHLWEDEVNLNTMDMPKAGSNRDFQSITSLGMDVRRCTILDPNFWNRIVDGAPVNRRAWVLQERLLAPRVLHFCEGQIAWECRHLDAAESYPNGAPTCQLKSGEVMERVRLKALLPEEYGSHPFVVNKSELSDAAHENWKKIVERYSTTNLSDPKDKLVALAGIAEVMSAHIPGRYIAGLWEKYLASQLLWRVDPIFVNDRFEYPSTRPIAYRAPSFSWAAIDSQQGIRCGETKREDELEIAVENFHVQPKMNSPFGSIESGCYIILTCTLIKVEVDHMERNVPGQSPSVYYNWTMPAASPAQNRKIHPIVYLDSPNHDYNDLRGPHGQVFCVPCYRDPESHWICLLLQRKRDGSGYYRRVGLTKVPPYVGAMETIWSQRHPRETIRIV